MNHEWIIMDLFGVVASEMFGDQEAYDSRVESKEQRRINHKYYSQPFIIQEVG